MRLPRTLMGLLLAAACSGGAEPPIPTGPLPEDSLYQLDLQLLDQAGATQPLALYRGHPTAISMFYASCPAACPLLIEDLHRLEAGLSPDQKADLRVLLVSFDPAADTPAALAQVVQDRGVDSARWTLASTPDADVRALAAVLGIAYRRLESGDYNHSSVITLLDAEGRPEARVEGLGQDLSPLIAALEN